MTGHITAILAVALVGVALWGVLGHREASIKSAALRVAQADASAAKAEATAARFNHSVAIEALREAERERDSIAATLEQWRNDHADDLKSPADPATLDLIERLLDAGNRDGDIPD